MIDLIVVGGGEGTYNNIWAVTQSKDPLLDMRIAAVIDVLPKEKLHPKMQEIIELEKIRYLHPDELDKAVFSGNLAGIVMTPNDSHVEYAAFFAARRIPVWVEKPLAVSLYDLERLLSIPDTFLKNIYCAEYCVDGRMLNLLYAAGAISKNDPRNAYISNPEKMKEAYGHLGRLISIQGKMLEGEGTAGTADHRPWLLEGNRGGMIRDLLSHLFGPLYDAGLASSEVMDLQVKLGRYDKGMALGQWRPLKSASEGETYAVINGRFLMPEEEATFEFEVGKYWPKHDRFLELTFEKGFMRMSYEKPFEATIENKDSMVTSSITVDFYPTLAFLDFKRFIERKTHGHIGRAIAIVKMNEQARKAGLRGAGL